MKTTLIALATVLGLSSAAFADPSSLTIPTAPVTKSAPAVETTAPVKIKIVKAKHSVAAKAEGGFASQAGIDVNPNFLIGF